MALDPQKPYNDLPPLPPDIELESPQVLKKAIAANAAVAELKGILNTIPNPAILINAIVLQEAKSSSLIENVVTTNDKLYQSAAAISSEIDPSTKEVLNYREAIWQGYRQLQQRSLLTSNAFIRIVNTIKGNTAGIRTTPGTTIATTSGKILYTPPEGETVLRDKLKNLQEFIHDEDDALDPLVKMALVHYQFEAIHPFYDGNGRTGRIINILYLVYKNLLPMPVLYLSKYIIEHKDEYYQLLRAVTESNEWKPWILFLLDGIEETAKFTVELVDNIRMLLSRTAETVKEKLPKIYSRELVEILFEEPYCRGQNLVQTGIASRNTASKYLRSMADIGILEQQRVGKENLYLNIQLWELLKSS
ncbi:MAG: Fic family protein [Deltaproteobacteria bacterium]|nr:Fic family protein [Deltaproteobacteria bacterium]